MTASYDLKSVLHQFIWEWRVEQQENNMLGISYLYEKIRKADWFPIITSLSEQERVAILIDAFVTDPPNRPADKTHFIGSRGPKPLIAFWLGVICLDTKQAVEYLFLAALKDNVDGRLADTAVKPLGAMRTIDLVFQTHQNPDALEDFLYNFELTLLPEVPPQDRDAVKQYYIKRRIESLENNRRFSSTEEVKEYAKRLDARLDYYLSLPDMT